MRLLKSMMFLTLMVAQLSLFTRAVYNILLETAPMKHFTKSSLDDSSVRYPLVYTTFLTIAEVIPYSTYLGLTLYQIYNGEESS